MAYPRGGAAAATRFAHPTRSSVGSVTTLSNLLRMLYSRAGDYPRNQPLLYAESFSSNTPEGACPECHGLGHVYQVTERSMVPDDSLTFGSEPSPRGQPPSTVRICVTSWSRSAMTSIRRRERRSKTTEGDGVDGTRRAGRSAPSRATTTSRPPSICCASYPPR
jgi:hypothetical protein